MSSSEKRGDTGLASMGQVFRRLLEMHGVDAVGIARQAGVVRSVQVLEESMTRIGTFAVALVSPHGERDTAPSWTDAVA